ncbi:hypothetical protein E2C01_026426 [Portunus trituberculatus]|uniref:Uncharacterized protein n=1 Tax=Portunus trituberculatus TaxID=210409 RepID=A0A5B7EI45_PORTR|nr:hypothetical protein [Portunus trituberculatus]
MAIVSAIMTQKPCSKSLIKIHIIQQQTDILSYVLDGRVLIYEVLLNVNLYCTDWDVECEGRKEQQGWPGNGGKKLIVNSDKNHQTNTKYRKHITIAVSAFAGALASPGSQKHTHHSKTLKNTGAAHSASKGSDPTGPVGGTAPGPPVPLELVQGAPITPLPLPIEAYVGVTPRETDLSWARGGGLWRGGATTVVVVVAVVVAEAD